MIWSQCLQNLQSYLEIFVYHSAAALPLLKLTVYPMFRFSKLCGRVIKTSPACYDLYLIKIAFCLAEFWDIPDGSLWSHGVLQSKLQCLTLQATPCSYQVRSQACVATYWWWCCLLNARNLAIAWKIDIYPSTVSTRWVLLDPQHPAQVFQRVILYPVVCSDPQYHIDKFAHNRVTFFHLIVWLDSHCDCKLLLWHWFDSCLLAAQAESCCW